MDGHLRNRPHTGRRIQQQAVPVDGPEHPQNRNSMPDGTIVWNIAECKLVRQAILEISIARAIVIRLPAVQIDNT